MRVSPEISREPGKFYSVGAPLNYITWKVNFSELGIILGCVECVVNIIKAKW